MRPEYWFVHIAAAAMDGATEGVPDDGMSDEERKKVDRDLLFFPSFHRLGNIWLHDDNYASALPALEQLSAKFRRKNSTLTPTMLKRTTVFNSTWPIVRISFLDRTS